MRTHVFAPGPNPDATAGGAVLFILLAGRLMAEPAGPTLHFDYGAAKSAGNPLVKFMYFVPLISPELISVSTNAGNTQCARVLSSTCRTNGTSFQATCEFEFTGDGVQRNIFDHTPGLKRHDTELKAGKTLSHQIMAISVEGNGRGTIEIEGTMTNGVRVANEIKHAVQQLRSHQPGKHRSGGHLPHRDGPGPL